MKQRWVSFVKDYLTYTKKDRVGLFVFIILATLFYLYPTFVPTRVPDIPDEAFKKELASLKITVDTSTTGRYYPHDLNIPPYSRKHFERSERYTGELFFFDPNTLSETGWKRLGVKTQTIKTISNFLGKGYVFKSPKDIRRIYGLKADEAERLIPYVRISANPSGKKDQGTFEPSTSTAYTAPVKITRPVMPAVIDINKADSNALIALPGIGSRLASRIINFREKLGGFVSVQQVGETYGIPDSTFQKILPRLSCEQPVVHTININEADVTTLRNHPYIKWNIANAIVNYRQQHGNYRSLDDLKKIVLIDEQLFQKIVRYLSLA
ncbi:hypothetical protein EXU57_22500 [Segetibacter sp. 3557_3]|uniref:ComEA family DNA-binding protein n=1 Tax=Segetibacter sp. 3557_3 TaxID=2547429 RepID=UPI0010588C1C|nr:helix-hairpin-helix domain-containing protein [Segetibacter sp. 3557_3]TDH19828.1 hypothetical protein EXU57_22500 [Segetibacter sp. 3557_3]